MNRLSIERAILSSYIYQYHFNTGFNIKLDPNDFKSKFHRWLIKQLNKYQRSDPMLIVDAIEKKLEGSKWEDEYLEVLASNPLPKRVAIDYLETLKEIRILEEADNAYKEFKKKLLAVKGG